jgi:hypothetical protein
VTRSASDETLVRFGIQFYKQDIDEIDPRGAFPEEMVPRKRHPLPGFALHRAIRYAPRQCGYQARRRTLRDAIVSSGHGVDDPGLVRPYTTDVQSSHFGSGDFAAFAFYTARFGTEALPPEIVNALKNPTIAMRIG